MTENTEVQLFKELKNYFQNIILKNFKKEINTKIDTLHRENINTLKKIDTFITKEKKVFNDTMKDEKDQFNKLKLDIETTNVLVNQVKTDIENIRETIIMDVTNKVMTDERFINLIIDKMIDKLGV
jgi:hypothetical protein